MSLEGKKIILGISGSIAAYKGVYLLRLLQKAGAEVKVVCTPTVSHFVGELTFSSLTGTSVFSGLWEEKWSEHVELGTWADLMVIAPATANTLAKCATGICDNALLAVYLAARCPVLVAPAMDVDMFLHPRVQHNLQILKQDGVRVLETGTGYLASGLEGPGRLLEPEEILQAIEKLFARTANTPLKGKKILISAGPTQEALDPVRYISNHSSGKMGYALAEVAQSWGAEVSLVSGPTALSSPSGVDFYPVVSAREMFECIKGLKDKQDILIMAAAVSDYAPADIQTQKIKKKGESLELTLHKTTDILKYLGQNKGVEQFLVGFALETNNAQAHAEQKLRDKNLDLIVLNSLEDEGAGFGHNTNKITLIDRAGNAQAFPLKPKKEVAVDILDKIVQLISL